MKNLLIQRWWLNKSWLHLVIVLLLLIGIFFRFVNLEDKIYWIDETYTSLRISGYGQLDATLQIFDGHVVNSKNLQKFQQINPDKGVFSTVESLALGDPQHSPLYYIMVRLWAQLFGTSVAAIRSLSALISLLAFPCIYWLCRELFDSSLTGWIGAALIAISPIHLLYAQQARQYGLWIVTILLASAALLRAMRLKNKFSWGIYALTLALALYTHLFSVFVAFGHGIYVILNEKFRFNKNTIAYLLSSIVGFIEFSPWLYVVITNAQAISNGTSSTGERVSLLTLFKLWSFNFSRIFLDIPFDFDVPFDMRLGYDKPWTYLLPPIFILIGYSIYFVCLKTPKKTWLFIITLIGIPTAILVIPDLISGGYRSGINRYLIPSFLGIQLAVAYLLATKVSSIPLKVSQQKLWNIILVVLLSGGTLSCAFMAQANTWWDKASDYYDAEIASIINKSQKPLLILDTSPMFVFPLSHRLDPKVKYKLSYQPEAMSAIPDGFSDIYVYGISASAEKLLKSRLEKEPQYEAKVVFNKNLSLIAKQRIIRLWRLEKKLQPPG